MICDNEMKSKEIKDLTEQDGVDKIEVFDHEKVQQALKTIYDFNVLKGK